MKKKLLCPICETGKQSLTKDGENIFCPYLYVHNIKTCPMFKEIKETDEGKKS